MTAITIRAVSLPNGGTVSALGLGTWYMGEQSARRATELAALRTGIESGLTARRERRGDTG
jgi:diketogulonate reductase-like aldo/keto reductase